LPYFAENVVKPKSVYGSRLWLVSVVMCTGYEYASRL